MKVILLGIGVLCVFGCNSDDPNDSVVDSIFENEQKISINGYSSDAMEPFISKDGNTLFFNNLKGANGKDIYYAERVNDSTFEFKGEVEGVNTDAVDGNPTMDAQGKFYFISTRDYTASDSSTIFQGNFNNGTVTDLQKVTGTINIPTPSWLNMGVEISADGKTMYTSFAFFELGNNFPSKSEIRMAHFEDGAFNIPNNEASFFSDINAEETLEYAGEISKDELEMVYTQLIPSQPPVFKLFRTSRNSKDQPFDSPTPILEPFKNNVQAFVEGPTLTTNGKIMYYHKLENGVFSIFMLTRN